MVEGSCHCGAVRFEVAAPPQQVSSCNCSICRRLGTLWAYYRSGAVRIEGATETYSHGEHKLEFHRCKICGCVTHWANIDQSLDRMAVNARLMPAETVVSARLRHFDGAESWKYLD